MLFDVILIFSFNFNISLTILIPKTLLHSITFTNWLSVYLHCFTVYLHCFAVNRTVLQCIALFRSVLPCITAYRIISQHITLSYCMCIAAHCMVSYLLQRNVLCIKLYHSLAFYQVVLQCIVFDHSVWCCIKLYRITA